MKQTDRKPEKGTCVVRGNKWELLHTCKRIDCAIAVARMVAQKDGGYGRVYIVGPDGREHRHSKYNAAGNSWVVIPEKERQ